MKEGNHRPARALLAEIAAAGEIAKAGRALGRRRVSGLLALLGDRRKPVQRAAAEVCAMVLGGEPWVRGALRARLRQEDESLRWGAAFALCSGGDRSRATFEALIGFLAAGDSDVRWAAASALSRMVAQSPPFAARLCRAAESGQARLRLMVLYCLRDSGRSTAAVERLVVSATRDREARVRLAAVSALGRLGFDRRKSSRRLIALLRDPDERVRRGAGAALGTLGRRDRQVVAALERACASCDPALAKAARRSLALLLPPAHG